MSAYIAIGAELDRRRAAVATLYASGASTTQVAMALRISAPTVRDDLDAQGIARRARCNRWQRLTETPRPIPWRSADVAREQSAGPMYTRSMALSLWRVTLAACRDERMAEQLKKDADDAAEVGDAGWLEEARAVIAEAHAYLARMTAALDESSDGEGLTNRRDLQRRVHHANLSVVL